MVPPEIFMIQCENIWNQQKCISIPHEIIVLSDIDAKWISSYRRQFKKINTDSEKQFANIRLQVLGKIIVRRVEKKKKRQLCKIKSADTIYMLSKMLMIGRMTNTKQNSKLGVGGRDEKKFLSKILLKWLKMQWVPIYTKDDPKCL